MMCAHQTQAFKKANTAVLYVVGMVIVGTLAGKTLLFFHVFFSERAGFRWPVAGGTPTKVSRNNITSAIYNGIYDVENIHIHVPAPTRYYCANYTCSPHESPKGSRRFLEIAPDFWHAHVFRAEEITTYS